MRRCGFNGPLLRCSLLWSMLAWGTLAAETKPLSMDQESPESPMSTSTGNSKETPQSGEKPTKSSEVKQEPSADEKAEQNELPPIANSNPGSILGEQAELPTIDEIPIPTSGELLQGIPFDWIVLITDKVVVVDPVNPRPGTLDKMEQTFQELSKIPLPDAEKNPAGREELLMKRRAARFLDITLQAGDELEFSIERKYIKTIRYFEDVVLDRIDLLLKELKTGEAYELLEFVYDREPEWPGLAEAEKSILYSEASLRESQGNLEDSLGFLERLYERDVGFPGLEDSIVRVTGKLTRDSIDQQEYRRARFFIKRLKDLYSSQPAIKERSQELIESARANLTLAIENERNSEFDVAIAHAETATRIWPTLPDLRSHFERMHTRYQRIRVGVTGFAHNDAADRLFEGIHDRRIHDLTQISMFRAERIDGVTLRYRSRIVDEWEPTALGRSIIFHPRFRRHSWESLPQIRTSRLVEQILLRTDPESAIYDERLDSLIDEVEFRSPLEFEVRFSQVPLNAPALFTFDVISADEKSGLEPSLPGAGRLFRLVRESGKEQVFERSLPESFSLPVRHVARVSEVLYADRDKAVQGLIRGEVDLVDDLQPWDVGLLGSQANVFVLPYAVPETHVIQFHPRSVACRNRALRFALSLAIDREDLLQSRILGGVSSENAAELGSLTTSIFQSGHPGFNQTLKPPISDPRLAISMVQAAGKELQGGVPKLKLAISDAPNPSTIPEELVSQWKRVGIEVELVSSDVLTTTSLSSDAPEWDLVYRIANLQDPQVELWPFLTFQKHPTVSALSSLPAWLRQKLLLLDQAGDFDTANERLRELHQLLWSEVEVVPLWQLRKHLAARKHLRGLSEEPMYFYQNVEQWRSLPWYPTEVE